MAEKKESLFSKSIKVGSRAYFIDVKETSKGDKYLSICESKKVEGEFQRNRVLVFSDAIPGFFQALREAAPIFKG